MLQIFQELELPAETDKLETHLGLLVTKRAILLQGIYNSSWTLEPGDNATSAQFKQVRIKAVASMKWRFSNEQEVDSALTEYEAVISDASAAGVDVVNKDYSNNWDYIQSCFFALTILTTIGKN